MLFKKKYFLLYFKKLFQFWEKGIPPVLFYLWFIRATAEIPPPPPVSNLKQMLDVINTKIAENHHGKLYC